MRKVLSTIVMISIVVLVVGCPEGIDGEPLTVYFLNRSASVTIDSLNYSTGSGTWSANVVPTGKTLGPGKYMVFDIVVSQGSDIPYMVTVGSQTFQSTTEIPLEIWYRGYGPLYCSVTLSESGDSLQMTGAEYNGTSFWDDVNQSEDLVQ